ncbi:MAG: 5'/3'-nucleotidase SurE [Planctomycetaceae bacterium]|nr:5'/3'-nucleotidase SurE [Planctomycetaceae bacterium]
MKFLLTNDDGVNAAGLRAVEYFLLDLGHEVFVAAPSGEQSGVSRSITFLTPLFATKAYDGLRFRGYAVDGTPVDCVKLALYELCPWRPDVVISGINGGLNAGINIHYSGTVGGAFEAAVSGIVSFALSLEYQDDAPYEQAMNVLWPVMQSILAGRLDDLEKPVASRQAPSHVIYNINVPTIALHQPCPVSVVPMESRRNGIEFNSGHCPKNRRYYWATHDLLPEQPEPPTDVFALRQGHITVTPLEINMTCDAQLLHLQERLQGIQVTT